MIRNLTSGGPALWSGLFIVLAVIFFIGAMMPVASALLRPSLDDREVAEEFDRLISEHEQTQASYVARFDGRSIFFKPRPVREPEPERVVQRTPEPPPPPPPPQDTGPEPPPPTYTGPSIRGFWGDEVWFHGDLRIKVGQEKDGVQVLAVNPPWSARIAHARGEYDVPLFERSMDDLLAGAGSSNGRLTGLLERGEADEAASSPEREASVEPADDGSGDRITPAGAPPREERSPRRPPPSRVPE
jgi:hypothetical protein